MISWERYEEIKTRVSEVFEDYEPKGLPIDIFGLAQSMGIKILYASKMMIENNNISAYTANVTIVVQNDNGKTIWRLITITPDKKDK